MSCTSPCVFCCISHNFAFGGRSVTLVMDHGTMSRLMFGLINARRLPCKMKERMRQMCVPGALLHLWGTNCFLAHAEVIPIDVEIIHFPLCSVLCREGLRSTLVDLGGSSRGG